MQAIVAVDENWGIGKDGGLLCHISADLKYFKSVTMGHAVILGRKTLATFPKGKPLAGRENRILSTTMTAAPEGAKVYGGVEELLKEDTAEAFVIGGGQVYEQLLPYCTEVYVTHIEGDFGADTFFPNLDADPDWVLERKGPRQEEQGIFFRFDLYRRKEP